jgi:hypothetical protein
MRGDGGDDTFVVSDGEDAIAGAGGEDTLALDGAGAALDLTSVDNGRISDIEVIDITGSGDNALTLALDDVLDASTTTDTLTIDGDTGDTLAVTSGSWADGGRDGDYNVYTSDLARLNVYWQITTEITTA